MNALSVTPPASAVTLKSLDANGIMPNEVAILILQAPAGNGTVLKFGSSAVQPFEIAAGDPFYYVPADVESGRVDTRELYVSGDGADTLSVSWVGLNKTK